MPISDTLISSAIKGYMALSGFTGRDMNKIADAVGRAVFIHVSIPNNTSASMMGTVGPVGSVSSLAVAGVIPTAMSAFMKAKGAQNGFKGRDMTKLADAISNGTSQVLMTMMLTGSSVGLALGAGTAKFVGLNANILGGLIKVQLAGLGFTGRDMFKLADMVATGVVQHLQTSATFSVMAVGAIAPVPPVGPMAIAGIPTIFSKVS
jgi:hypothetical protein